MHDIIGPPNQMTDTLLNLGKNGIFHLSYSQLYLGVKNETGIVLVCALQFRRQELSLLNYT